MSKSQWRVSAYTGKNRNINLGFSFVLADSERDAIELGRRALRLIGVRGRFNVDARPYRPERDFEFAGYIAEVRA